jgi:hypothetical protein
VKSTSCPNFAPLVHPETPRKRQRTRGCSGGGHWPERACPPGAIDRQTRLADLHCDFVADALVAREETYRSDLGYSADESHRQMQARAWGEKATRPEARKWWKHYAARALTTGSLALYDYVEPTWGCVTSVS